jgi:hypothetical protein
MIPQPKCFVQRELRAYLARGAEALPAHNDRRDEHCVPVLQGGLHALSMAHVLVVDIDIDPGPECAALVAQKRGQRRKALFQAAQGLFHGRGFHVDLGCAPGVGA